MNSNQQLNLNIQIPVQEDASQKLDRVSSCMERLQGSTDCRARLKLIRDIEALDHPYLTSIKSIYVNKVTAKVMEAAKNMKSVVKLRPELKSIYAVCLSARTYEAFVGIADHMRSSDFLSATSRLQPDEMDVFYTFLEILTDSISEV